MNSYNRGLSKVNFNPMRGINFSEPQSIPDVKSLQDKSKQVSAQPNEYNNNE